MGAPALCVHCGVALTGPREPVHMLWCRARAIALGIKLDPKDGPQEIEKKAKKVEQAEEKRRLRGIALAKVRELGLSIPTKEELQAMRKRRCPLCDQCRDDEHISQYNAIRYCPYAHPKELQERLRKEMAERKRRR